jgi:hypothetical protein
MIDPDEETTFLAKQIYRDRGPHALRYVSARLCRSLEEVDFVGAEAWYQVARAIVEMRKQPKDIH